MFLADLNCLPGMEGATVTAPDGSVAGMLAVPLSHADFDAQARLALCFLDVSSLPLEV